jgi:predicted nucleic acid-binding protein
MIIICDTSPLNYLILVELIEVVPKLMPEVVAPPEVIAELRREGASDPVRRWAAHPPGWLEVRSAARMHPGLGLHLGEAAAISLALEIRVDSPVQLLMDERVGRQAARQLGLPTLGTLGVLRDAARAGLIDIDDSVARLRKTRFRATDALYEQLIESVRKGTGG